MPRPEWAFLSDAVALAGNLPGRWLADAKNRIALDRILGGSCLGGRTQELRGRTVLLAVKDQLTAALSLIELDGVARRIVLCPPDLSPGHVGPVAAIAEADAVVSDQLAGALPAISAALQIAASSSVMANERGRRPDLATEWILLTSGTTGLPKLVQHSLASLAGPVSGAPIASHRPVWSTFYDIRRYGGLQIFLRAMMGGGSLLLSDAGEATAGFLARAKANGVTHISGTPTHWRQALMSPEMRSFQPDYIRLSGEIADQTILDALRQAVPQASIAHAYASTEAGVAFAVEDGRAGFPASLIGQSIGEVDMQIDSGTLAIRSGRTASRYLGASALPLHDAAGFVDTGDMIERIGERYHFVGRRGGIINVGGAKVHPEEVEAVINTHPDVQMSLVRARKSPITGAVVVADVVLRYGVDGHIDVTRAILAACQAALPAHKVPATIRVVSELAVTPSGKLVRQNA